jgi:hypothetical protein
MREGKIMRGKIMDGIADLRFEISKLSWHEEWGGS